jgi:tight adherence protein C
MDPMVLVIIMVGVLVFLGVFALLFTVSGKLTSLEERVRQLGGGGETSRFKAAQYGVSVLKRLGGVLTRSPEEMSRQERRLVNAGIRRRDGPVLFYGAQAVVAIAFLTAFALTGNLQKHVFLFGILSIFLGALLPDIWLSLKIARRKRRIQLALPDALDLQVVCVEAGLGLDQSLMRIGQEIRKSHPDLSEELHLLNLELNAGKSRAEAMRNLARRTEVEDLRSLVAVLIQTDRFGTSIADSLRVYSDSLRTKRRQRAEELAAKMAVKMILPLVLFILPATFAVVAGPAVIGIAKGLLPLLKSGGP